MQVPQNKTFIIQLPLIYPSKQTLIKFIYIFSIPLKQNINKPFFLCAQMYENIDDGAFIGRKQYSVLMFMVNFFGLRLFYIYIKLKTQCIFKPCNELYANDSQTSWS